MSYKIFYSTSKRATSSAQNLMDDLAEQWDGWTDVTEEDGNITKLWLSENLYLSLESSYLYVRHVSTGANTYFNTGGSGGVISAYVIVVADKGLMWHTASSGSAYSFIIAKNGEDYGLIYNPSGTLSWYLFSESMQNQSVSARGLSGSTYSMFVTQLVDVVPEGDTAPFDGAYFVFLRPAQFMTGRYLINGKTYYINAASQLALQYE